MVGWPVALPVFRRPLFFLPDHDVTVRVSYTTENISDGLTYTTGTDDDL
jgi:hypothetical protein